MDIDSLASGIAGGGTVSGLLFVLARAYVAAVTRRQEATDVRVKHLEENRVAKIELDVDDLRRNGCASGIADRTTLQTLVAQSNEVLLGVHSLQRDAAKNGALLEKVEQSNSKLWEKFDEHRQHHPGKTVGG